MRYIPPEILQRIHKLNQTIYANADPKMEATLDLMHLELATQVLTEVAGLATEIDFCGRRENPDGPYSEFYFVLKSDNEAFVYKSFLISEKHGILIQPFVALGIADSVACAFDGTWAANGKFTTSGEPFFFWTRNGALYARHGDDPYVETISASGNSRVAAVRGWRSHDDISGEYDVTMATAEANAGVSVERAYMVTMATSLDGAQVTIYDHAGNQGLSVVTNSGSSIRRWYKRDWVQPWIGPQTIAIGDTVQDISAFRAADEGRVGYVVGLENEVNRLYVSEPWAHGVQDGYIELVRGSSMSVSQYSDGDLVMHYIQDGRRILATNAERAEDWSSIDLHFTDTEHSHDELHRLRSALLDGESLMLVWGQASEYIRGAKLPDEELEEYLVNSGTISLSLGNPIASVSLEIEAVPPRLPQVPKPVWLNGEISWQKVEEPEDTDVPTFSVTIHAQDDFESPLEGVEVEVTKEW